MIVHGVKSKAMIITLGPSSLAEALLILASYPAIEVGNQGSLKNSNSHIDASHSRQPLVKGERLVRYEVNAVMPLHGMAHDISHDRDATHSWLSMF